MCLAEEGQKEEKEKMARKEKQEMISSLANAKVISIFSCSAHSRGILLLGRTRITLQDFVGEYVLGVTHIWAQQEFESELQFIRRKGRGRGQLTLPPALRGACNCHNLPKK